MSKRQNSVDLNPDAGARGWEDGHLGTHSCGSEIVQTNSRWGGVVTASGTPSERLRFDPWRVPQISTQENSLAPS